MDTVGKDKIPLLDFGNKIQIVGVMFGGNGKVLFAQFPEEDLKGERTSTLDLTAEEWERVLHQQDVLDTVGKNKVILRKSQRQIDTSVSWQVFRRDGYKCRYCGQEKPLTVDHIDLWENGGVSTPDNLISACKPCNRTRGNTEYAWWLNSDQYKKVSVKLSPAVHMENVAVLPHLGELMKLRTTKQRSR